MAEERREVGSLSGKDPTNCTDQLNAKELSKAIKAFVLVKQQDAAIRQRGIDETVSLCRRNPAVTDLAALHQIQDSLKDLSLSSEEGTRLWDRAVAAKPEDKELAMTWLNRSIAENNWPGAQKVCRSSTNFRNGKRRADMGPSNRPPWHFAKAPLRNGTTTFGTCLCAI